MKTGIVSLELAVGQPAPKVSGMSTEQIEILSAMLFRRGLFIKDGIITRLPLSPLAQRLAVRDSAEPTQNVPIVHRGRTAPDDDIRRCRTSDRRSDARWYH